MDAVKKTEIEKLENSAVKLTITVKGKKTRESYDALVSKYAKEAQVKGFRKGKVPASVLEKKFGESMKAEAFYNLLEESVKEALEKVEEKPIYTSTPTLLEDDKLEPELDKDFTFAVQYDVYPAVELGAYEGVEVEVAEAKVLKADIDAELKKIQEQNAMMIDKSEGVVAKDDSVTVDYCELDEKEAEIDGTAGEDFTFTLGSGYSPYKLEEDVIGMKKDESKIVDKTFAEDDSDAKIAGRTVKVKVTVKTIKAKDLPALDDELAQDVSEEFQTVDDLKADAKKRLEEQLAAKKKELTVNGVFEKLDETSTIPLPESMVQAELQNNLQNFARQMGMQPEQLVEMLGKNSEGLEGLMNEWRPSTIKNLKQTLILNKVAEEQKIEASDDDVEQEFEKIAEANKRPVNEIKDYYNSNNAVDYLKNDIQNRKAMDFLVEKAAVKKGKKISFLDIMAK